VRWVCVLDMQVTLHDKRIVMQLTLHYEAIVMQVTLHDKRIVMQLTLHYEAIVMQVTLHDKKIVVQVTLHYEVVILTKNEGKNSFEVELDSKTLQLTTFADVQALLLCDDEMVQEGDKDEVLEAGEEMDEDILPTDEESQSQPPNQEQPESSYAQEQSDESESDSSCLDILKEHDNILPPTERQLAFVEGYYDENFDHMDQTDNLVKETMKTIDNISKFGIDERAKLLKALNRFSETLEVDSALKEEIKKMDESYNTTFGNLSGLTKLINNAKLLELLTKLKGFLSTLNTLSTQCASVSKSLKEDHEFNQSSSNALILTAPPPEVYASVGGEFREVGYYVAKTSFFTDEEQMQIVTTTKKPEDEASKTPMEQEPKRPTRAVPISTVKPITRTNLKVALIESASRPLLTDPILQIHVPQQTTLMIDITPPKPQVPQRERKGITTNEQPKSPPKLIPASYMDKEERIKKKAEEAKLLVMTKSELIKVVHEEAKKARIDPKTIESAKGGEQFKKIQDIEHQVCKREHSQEVKTNRAQEEDT
nr:hypothetical protein [Tanacetum cinerariifolium]